MGILKQFIENYKAKKEKIKDYEENIDIQERAIQKRKNSNERELERYYEEERQKQIEQQLKRFRKQRNDSMYKTTIFQGKNIFRNGPKAKLGGCNLLR